MTETAIIVLLVLVFIQSLRITGALRTIAKNQAVIARLITKDKP